MQLPIRSSSSPKLFPHTESVAVEKRFSRGNWRCNKFTHTHTHTSALGPLNKIHRRRKIQIDIEREALTMQFTFPTAITSDPRAGALATINSRRLSHEPKKQGPNGKRENRENRGLRNA